jgi:hypothetical protein
MPPPQPGKLVKGTRVCPLHQPSLDCMPVPSCVAFTVYYAGSGRHDETVQAVCGERSTPLATPTGNMPSSNAVHRRTLQVVTNQRPATFEKYFTWMQSPSTGSGPHFEHLQPRRAAHRVRGIHARSSAQQLHDDGGVALDDRGVEGGGALREHSTQPGVRNATPWTVDTVTMYSEGVSFQAARRTAECQKHRPGIRHVTAGQQPPRTAKGARFGLLWPAGLVVAARWRGRAALHESAPCGISSRCLRGCCIYPVLAGGLRNNGGVGWGGEVPRRRFGSSAHTEQRGEPPEVRPSNVARAHYRYTCSVARDFHSPSLSATGMSRGASPAQAQPLGTGCLRCKPSTLPWHPP